MFFGRFGWTNIRLANSKGKQTFYFWHFENFYFQPETELYDPWSESILGRRFIGHTDAVWSLSVQNDNLLSCSSDGTVKIWNIETAEVKFNYSNEVNGRPSDAKFTKESKKIIIRIVFKRWNVPHHLQWLPLKIIIYMTSLKNKIKVGQIISWQWLILRQVAKLWNLKIVVM